MLTAHQLYKSYGTQSILNGVTLSISARERIGLIGPNGCGKSTLMRILAGRERPDAGAVHRPPDLRVGYLSQGFEPAPERTVSEILADVSPDSATLQRRLIALASQLATNPEDESLQVEYDHVVQQLSTLDSGKREATMAALGLGEVDQSMPVAALSGGQKTRLALVLLLLEEPQLLLLDEPTNHLDIGMLEWLESWLASFAGAALIVSHDRAFLDRTVDQILALDPETQSAMLYAGNYSDYLQQFLQEREKVWVAYRDQEAEIRRVNHDIAQIKQKARGKEDATIDSKQRRYAKKVARLAKSREKKLDRFISSSERVDRPKRSWQVDLTFNTPGHIGQDVLELTDVAIGYAAENPLVAGINLTIRAGQRVVVSGPNGTGKTTLLKTVSGMLPPLAGNVRIGSSVRLGLMTQEQELLEPERNAVETIQLAAGLAETEVRNYLHHFLFKDDEPLTPTRDLSYGQRARLVLALLVAQGNTFLMLDEPINHLDIPSRANFEEALAQFQGTTLAVVHDRYFIERFATDIWWVEDSHIDQVIVRQS